MGDLCFARLEILRRFADLGAEMSESSAPQAPVSLDLSRFAVPEGADSDDESLVPSLPSLPCHPLGVEMRPTKPSASLRLPSPEAVLKPSDRPRSSPRSLLSTLDFKDLPVAE
eukprot:s3077_g2.t1